MALRFVAATFTVTGDLQGPSYKRLAKEVADKAELMGYIESSVDWNITGFVQGPQSKVQNFLAWLWKGDPRSTVSSVVSQSAGLKTPATLNNSFTIRFHVIVGRKQQSNPQAGCQTPQRTSSRDKQGFKSPRSSSIINSPKSGDDRTPASSQIGGE